MSLIEGIIIEFNNQVGINNSQTIPPRNKVKYFKLSNVRLIEFYVKESVLEHSNTLNSSYRETTVCIKRQFCTIWPIKKYPMDSWHLAQFNTFA